QPEIPESIEVKAQSYSEAFIAVVTGGHFRIEAKCAREPEVHTNAVNSFSNFINGFISDESARFKTWRNETARTYSAAKTCIRIRAIIAINHGRHTVKARLTTDIRTHTERKCC